MSDGGGSRLQKAWRMRWSFSSPHWWHGSLGRCSNPLVPGLLVAVIFVIYGFMLRGRRR